MKAHTLVSGAGAASASAVAVRTAAFWTARQRQGHSLHEISYRACFKPQLPEYFIKRYSRTGDTVLDPFMGRGTTVLQASLMDRVGIGSDINPLSAMLLRPRLHPPPLDALRRRIRKIPMAARVPVADRELLVFFHPKVLRVLVSCKRWFAKREDNGTFDAVDDWLRMVCINRLTGHSPGFLSVKTMPPNQCVSLASQRDINRKHSRSPQTKDFEEIILKKSRSLLRSGRPSGAYTSRARAECSAAHQLAWLSDRSVDLLITSPPFVDIVDYSQDNWMRCWFAGIATGDLAIDRHRDIASWRSFVRRCFEEFARVVKPGGHIAFEVGEVRQGKILLEREVIDTVAALPSRWSSCSSIDSILPRHRIAGAWPTTPAARSATASCYSIKRLIKKQPPPDKMCRQPKRRAALQSKARRPRCKSRIRSSGSSSPAAMRTRSSPIPLASRSA